VPGAAKHGDKAKDKKIESKEKVEGLHAYHVFKCI
jgi:hypothetical protein